MFKYSAHIDCVSNIACMALAAKLGSLDAILTRNIEFIRVQIQAGNTPSPAQLFQFLQKCCL